VKIEALAQLGQMLMSMKKHKGGNPVPKENRVDTHGESLTLAELKIDKKTSMVAQQYSFQLKSQFISKG